MAALHDALKTLSSITASEFPSSLDLAGYLADCLQDTHILLNSIPLPDASLCHLPSDPNLVPLRKEWKPVKLGAKENAMGFSVYKLPAKDGGGTWFARRSVHEELGFRKFRAGLMKEFDSGNEAGGSVRSLGRERQMERQQCALGQAKVNYLTAQFPGPSAPRDFVTASLTSSAHPGDISPSSSSDSSGACSRSSSNTTASSDEPKPRQFTVISRPLKDHPECPERQGYVRGQIESVEFIREIPAVCNPPINRRSMDTVKRVQNVPNVSSLEQEEERVGRKRRTMFVGGSVPGDGDGIMSPRGQPPFSDQVMKTADGFTKVAESAPQPHPEQNPVEWILITRSDPGGSVPRWLVDRGTPAGIVKDAEMFIDWAANKDDLEEWYPEEAEYEEAVEGTRVGGSESTKEGVVSGQQIQGKSKREIHGAIPGEATQNGDVSTGTQQEETGLLSSTMSTVSAAASMLAPPIIALPPSSPSDNETAVVNDENLPPPRHSPGTNTPETNPDYIDNDDAASINSFATARSNELERGTASLNSTSTNPLSTHTPSMQEGKALARLLREKEKLSGKLERQRSRVKKKKSKEDEREQKLLEKHMKEVEKREARYSKDIEKARRREEKKRAKELTKEQREVEELKKVVQGLIRENLELKEKVEMLEGKERLKEVEATVIDEGCLGREIS